ncbi:hypothetical protein EJD97_000582, partial [Solanum chilense]
AVMDFVVPYCANSSASLSINLDDMYDGQFQARRSIEGLCSIKLKLHGIWVLDNFFDHHEEPVERTVIATTVRHALRNSTLGQTSPSSFSSFTTMPPTDRHRHDGPSQ